MSIKAAITVVAMAALVATGCSGSVTGNASPTSTENAGSASSSATGTLAQDVFGSMNSCQILDQLVLGQGFESGSNDSTRNQCIASKPDYATYSVALDSSQGLTEFNADNTGAVPTSVNGRTALRAQPSSDLCVFALEVGWHARALAVVSMTRTINYAQACPNAKQLAERLEPLLPRDQ